MKVAIKQYQIPDIIQTINFIIVWRKLSLDTCKVSVWSVATVQVTCGGGCLLLFVCFQFIWGEGKKSNHRLWRTYCVLGTCLTWFVFKSLPPASPVLSHKSQDTGAAEICLVLQMVKRGAFHFAVPKVLPPSWGFWDLQTKCWQVPSGWQLPQVVLGLQNMAKPPLPA